MEDMFGWEYSWAAAKSLSSNWQSWGNLYFLLHHWEMQWCHPHSCGCIQMGWWIFISHEAPLPCYLKSWLPKMGIVQVDSQNYQSILEVTYPHIPLISCWFGLPSLLPLPYFSKIDLDACLSEWSSSLKLHNMMLWMVTSSSPWLWSYQCASGFLLLFPPVPWLVPSSMFGQVLSSLLLGGPAVTSEAAVDIWENKVSVENKHLTLRVQCSFLISTRSHDLGDHAKG